MTVSDLGCALDQRSKPIIGLTGGIGAGKSSAARVLVALGAAIIDSDRLAHEQLREPEVMAALRAWWGDEVLQSDGSVDRKAVAAIVFNDADALARLENLLYPRIAVQRDRLIGKYDADPSVRAVVLDTPKLIETGLNRTCDAVIFIDARREVRFARVLESRGWSMNELDRREKLQNALDKKRELADYIVVNNSDVEGLRSSVEQTLSSILASFKQTR